MIDKTKIWEVNDQFVVADTIEEAIQMFHEYYEYPQNEVKKVTLVEHRSGNVYALFKPDEK